jgi:hypothetical protein
LTCKKIPCDTNTLSGAKKGFKMSRKKRINCWEFKKCGRELGGSNTDDSGICPASTTEKLNGLHGGTNAGRACWFVVGTLCNGDIQGSHTKKYKSCIYCDFFRKVKEEEYLGSPFQQDFSS